MKLYLCVPECDGFSFEIPQLVTGENLEEVKDKLADNYGVNQQWIDYIDEENIPFTVILDIFRDNKKILFDYIEQKGKEVNNYSYIANFYTYLFRNMEKSNGEYTNLDAWEYQEIDVPDNIENKSAYLVYADQYDGIEDVTVVFAEDKEQAFYIYSELEAKNSLLREYVNDRCGFADQFWSDEKGYMLSFDYQTEKEIPREDIIIRFRCDDNEIYNYIFGTFKKNVNEFFRHEPSLADAFLMYYEDEGKELPEEIYQYITFHGNDRWSQVKVVMGLLGGHNSKLKGLIN